jgi:hypothetical protein
MNEEKQGTDHTNLKTDPSVSSFNFPHPALENYMVEVKNTKKFDTRNYDPPKTYAELKRERNGKENSESNRIFRKVTHTTKESTRSRSREYIDSQIRVRERSMDSKLSKRSKHGSGLIVGGFTPIKRNDKDNL